MSDKSAWHVHVKGRDSWFIVDGGSDPSVDREEDTVSFLDGEGEIRALFPMNAVTAIVRERR